MRNIFLKGAILLLLSYSPLLTNAQKFIPDNLRQQLQGKIKLPDIMQVVDTYYAGTANNGGPGEEEKAYIHWKRWEWWMSSHLDENGNFVRNINRLNFDGLNEADRKWGTQINQMLLDNQGRNLNRTAVEREQSSQFGNGGNESENFSFGNWSFLGPTGDGAGPGDIKGKGRLDRIAFHPTDGNIIYVGSPSGNLWKTTNGGTTWISVTDGLTNPGIAGVAVSPTNGNIIYILTGDGDSYNPGYLVYDYGSSRASIGVFKSIDGGTSWTKTGDLYTGGDYEGHKLAVSPTNGNLLLATTSQGIYRTTDGGVTWTQVKTGEHWDVVFKPGSQTTVYATSGSAIFYSTLGGVAGSWNTATTDFAVTSSGRIELAVSAANTNYVYALCGLVTAAGQFTGIFRSTNSGVSYTRRTNVPNILGSEENGSGSSDQSAYDLGITAKPTDAEYIATCALNVWVSNGSNGGSAMVWSTKYREGYAGAANKYIHPDVHAVAYNPLNNFLYAASDGGFYRSTDDGLSWTNFTNSIATSQLYGLAMRDSDGDGDGDGLGFLTGAQDNGMKHRTNAGSTNFNHVICCDGYGTAIPAKSANILYMNINSNFYKSTDGGATTVFRFGVTFFSPIVCDYIQSDTVYIGGTSTRRSYDGFATASNLTVATSTRRVLATCPSNQARLYGSAGTNIVRSDDRIATWTTKSGTAGWPVGTFTINDIEVYPTNSSEVYACFGGYSAGNKVMRSTTGGDSWVNWSGSLPNVPTYSLAVATEGVYVGTEFGVFFRSYSMTDWVPYYNWMPRSPVTEIAVNNNGLIYASTFGRGVWQGNRRSACTSLLTIAGNLTGPIYYEAGNGVNATITTSGTYGDEIFVQAGDTVVMLPGFEIKTGSYFKAYIAPCSNGGIPVANRPGTTEADMFLVPHITEINPGKKKPALAGNYFAVVDNKIEFNIAQKGKLEMLGKHPDGSWGIFYPGDIFYPGFYSIPMPERNIMEFKLLLSGKEIMQLK